MRQVVLIVALMTGMLFAGMAGFHWVEGWPWFDCFYMSLMTLTTVGYGELFPMTQQGRWVASAMMLGGVTTLFIAIGVMADLVIKIELADYFGRRRRHRMIAKLTGHYIVCGSGRVGRAVAEELLHSGVPIVLLDSNPQKAQWGFDQNIPTLVSDASQDTTLLEAGIGRAKGLVAATGSDAQNVYVTLTARGLSPELLISARATEEQAAEKLRRAGATTVFTPYSFIGHRLAQSMLRPHVLSFLDIASAVRKSADLDLDMEQVLISQGSRVAGKTLEESRLRQRFGVIVLAVSKPDGQMQFNPAGGTRIEAGDVLIAMGERSKLTDMEAELEV